jgi:hypothetical protein
MVWDHPDLANVSVGAKYDCSKSLILTNNLSAVMLRPYKIVMFPMVFKPNIATAKVVKA